MYLTMYKRGTTTYYIRMSSFVLLYMSNIMINTNRPTLTSMYSRMYIRTYVCRYVFIHEHTYIYFTANHAPDLNLSFIYVCMSLIRAFDLSCPLLPHNPSAPDC